MRMLDELKEVLDDIEKKDAWAHKFIQDISTQKEEEPEYKLTNRQFTKIQELHKKFCSLSSLGAGSIK